MDTKPDPGSKGLFLKECFVDYANRFSSKAAVGQRKKLADFARVSHETTASRWFRGALEPVGSNKWKAIVFFQLLGYDVLEFQVRPLYQDAALLYTLEVVTADEIFAAFAFTESKQPASRFFFVLNTDGEMLPERLASVESFVARHREDLAVAKELFVEVYKDVLLKPAVASIPKPVPVASPVTAVPPLVAAASPAVAKKGQSAKPVILESLAAMMAATLPLARMVASDTFTREDRAQLRELSGGDGIFKLSNLLEQLCSESARKKKGVQ